MRKTLRELLDSGKKFVGAYMMYPSPENIEVMKLAGMDFVILDFEHGCLTSSEVMHMIRTADSVGLAVMIRVPEINEAMIKRALDMGASAIRVPMIRNAEDAKKVVELAKFPPEGKRGGCPHTRFNNYGVGDRTDCWAKSNKEVVISVSIEDMEGYEHLEEICQVEGIDLLNIGNVDLAMAMGVPGEVKHPKVKQAMLDVAAMAHRYGKTTHIFIFDAADAAEYQNVEGVGYFQVHVPHQMLYEGYRNLIDAIHKNCPD